MHFSCTGRSGLELGLGIYTGRTGLGIGLGAL